ncbi:unnamed protein product, partial [Penicillium discolor]
MRYELHRPLHSDDRYRSCPGDRLRRDGAGGHRAQLRADRPSIRRGPVGLQPLGAGRGRVRPGDARARLRASSRLVHRRVGGDRLRTHRGAGRRRAQPRPPRALPARDRMVAVRARLPLHPPRPPDLRDLVAAHAPARRDRASGRGRRVIVFRNPDEVPEDFGPSAVAIGKFDGVHEGHRAVIRRLEEAAAASGSRAVAVTFDRNPLAVIRPDRCPENVVTVDR